MSVYFDTSSNFHPYECDGGGKCVHCDRTKSAEHDPASCALCDPEYDMQPNDAWALAHRGSDASCVSPGSGT